MFYFRVSLSDMDRDEMSEAFHGFDPETVIPKRLRVVEESDESEDDFCGFGSETKLPERLRIVTVCVGEDERVIGVEQGVKEPPKKRGRPPGCRLQ